MNEVECIIIEELQKQYVAIEKKNRRITIGNMHEKMSLVMKSWLGLSMEETFFGWKQVTKERFLRLYKDESEENRNLRLLYESEAARFKYAEAQVREWKEHHCSDTMTYWTNQKTGNVSWDKPNVQMYLPSGWELPLEPLPKPSTRIYHSINSGSTYDSSQGYDSFSLPFKTYEELFSTNYSKQCPQNYEVSVYSLNKCDDQTMHGCSPCCDQIEDKLDNIKVTEKLTSVNIKEIETNNDNKIIQRGLDEEFTLAASRILKQRKIELVKRSHSRKKTVKTVLD